MAGRKVQLPTRPKPKRKRAPAPTRKREPSPRSHPARKKSRGRKQTTLKKNNRRLLHRVRQLEQQLAEATKQPPSKFPSPRDFAKAAKRRGEGGGGGNVESDSGSYTGAIHNRSREIADDIEDELEDFENTHYEDMFDWDYDDIYEDVGDEEEDGYGEDAAK